MHRCNLLLCLLLLSTAACNDVPSPSDAGAESGRMIEIDLDKSNPERLLRYYFGGYASAAGSNPFDDSLLVAREGAYLLDAMQLAAQHPGVEIALQKASSGAKMDWDALAGFLNETYYDVRGLPPTLADLQEAVPYLEDEADWFQVEIDGVMTAARRRVFVAKDALRAALRGYAENEEQLIYPVGTTIVGEHHLDDDLAETTVMQKREDGFWDFFTYDAAGQLSSTTHTPPRDLKTPTQCVGCHFGSKQFEPERSFPGSAPAGPNGPRAIHVGPQIRDADVVRFFQEHSKRSDTVLGLYNTLFVSDLRAQRSAGTLSDEDAQVLEMLGL